MSGHAGLRKDTDYETRFRCAGGIGILREEVWIEERGEVVRYNLAFLLPPRSSVDRGRVLGFDYAQGIHERHFLGEVRAVPYRGYLATAKRFFREVEALRKATRRSYEE